MYKIIVAILITASIASCNPAKKLARQQKQYKQIVDNYLKEYPQRIDTATTFLYGNVIDSSTHYKYAIDSIYIVKHKLDTLVEFLYRDTCTSVSLMYNQGYNIGYIAGVNSAMLNTKYVHDTLVRTIVPTDRINLLEKSNTTLEAEKNILLQQLKNNSKWLWYFIVAAILFVTTLIFYIIKIFKK